MIDSDRTWLERPRTIRLLWIAFAVVLAATVAAGIFVEMHGEFGLDGSFAFNAWYGFASCVALVLAAKILGLLLKRRASYYDSDG